MEALPRLDLDLENSKDLEKSKYLVCLEPFPFFARIYRHLRINIFILLKSLKQPVSSYDQQVLGSSPILKQAVP